MKNQLFRKVPSKDVVIRILKLHGIEGFDLAKSFTIKDFEERAVASKIKQFQPDLRTYYLKCKWKYITDLTPKKCLTLLRQLLKLYGYKLKSREKCQKGYKFFIYNICESEDTEITVSSELSKELKVSFT